LGLHVRKDGESWMLDTESAREDWCAVESLLEKAVSDVVQTAKGGPLPASFGIRARDRAVLSRSGVAVLEEDSGCCSPVAPATVARAGKTCITHTRTPRL